MGERLEDIAAAMLAPGKGILAADESGATIKKRLSYDAGKFGTLDAAALAYIQNTYFEHYGQAFPHELSRVVDMRYVRMTLVAKAGGERMTIDGQLRFFDPSSSHAVDGSTGRPSASRIRCTQRNAPRVMAI